MPSDFESIGLSISSAEEFIAFATKHAASGLKFPTPIGGSYVCAGEGGAEVWIQCDPEGQVIGAHPHFSGESKFEAVFQNLVPPARGTPLDGAILCTTEADQHGVPFVVDVPDFRLRAATLPASARVLLQVAAFPREVIIARDEAEFRSSKFGQLASDGAMIPSGTFRPGGQPLQGPPTSDVILSGRVTSSYRTTNSLSSKPFHAVALRVLGGVVDVPYPVVEGAPAPETGGIMAGSFALSARLLSVTPGQSANDSAAPQQTPAKKPGLFKRLFGS